MSEEIAETSPEPEVLGEEVETNEGQESEEIENLGADESEQEPEVVDDSEDLEFNGTTHKLPKTIAEAVRSMQKDYTVKTQAVAEQRKQFEAEVKFRSENINEIAEVTALDKQIQQYKNVDWNTLNQNDPVMFQQLRLQYDELKDARNELSGKLAQKHQAETLQKQQEFAKQMQESEAVLRRDIKDWSADKETELQQYAVKTFGFDLDDVVKSKADPRLYKLLHKAFVADQLIAKQAAKPKIVQQAQPVTNLTSNGAKVTKDPVDMSDSEFEAYRRRVIKRRGA